MMNEELQKILKDLRLWGILEHWDEYLKLAEKQHFSAVRLLTHVIKEEYKVKQGRAKVYRMQRAHIPEPFVMATFPFGRQRKLNKKKLLAIYDSFDYVNKCQNVIWVGPTGCGKTGLATSFLTHAIEEGCSGLYISFPELVSNLYASMADHTQEKVIKKYASCDCLLIDEVGYVEVEPAQVGLFFELMHKRHKTKTTLVTSNLGFSEWGSFLKNNHLTAALIDRLTENSHVINMKNCVSLRPKLGQEK
jgi:DNA replication protein DnaC